MDSPARTGRATAPGAAVAHGGVQILIISLGVGQAVACGGRGTPTPATDQPGGGAGGSGWQENGKQGGGAGGTGQREADPQLATAGSSSGGARPDDPEACEVYEGLPHGCVVQPMPGVEVDSSCRVPLELPSSAFNIAWLNVALDCSVVPMMGSPAGAGGAAEGPSYNWTVDDSTDPPSLEIVGEYCERVLRGQERLDVLFMCETYF